MEYLAPLIQTILWVGLITGILWRFYTPIHGILDALQKRIESGSTVKAGPFEIAEQLKPQDPLKQKEKVVIEMQEALELPPINTTNPALEKSQSSRVAKYFQAEDLVLRALQAEYGAKVTRQVTAGSDMGFDGAFVTNGRLNVVEVKYVTNASNISRFKSTIEKLSKAIDGYGWRNAQIILAVVFEKTEDLAAGSEKLQMLVQSSSVPVVVRCYSYTELQVQFGVEINDIG